MELYNSELITKLMYGDELGSYGVIEGVDIKNATVHAVLDVIFSKSVEIDGTQYYIHKEFPNYVMNKWGLYDVSSSIISVGDYIKHMSEDCLVIGIGTFCKETKSFSSNTGNNSDILIETPDEMCYALCIDEAYGMCYTYNFSTGEITNESCTVLKTKEQALHMFSTIESFSDFDDDWEDWE